MNVSNSSAIEWTEATWNPTTGCTKISPGCKNCYAEKLSKRLNAMGVQKYKNNFQFTEQPNDLKLPYTWKKPRRIFVNSMSDLFHEESRMEIYCKLFSRNARYRSPSVSSFNKTFRKECMNFQNYLRGFYGEKIPPHILDGGKYRK